MKRKTKKNKDSFGNAVLLIENRLLEAREKIADAQAEILAYEGNLEIEDSEEAFNISFAWKNYAESIEEFRSLKNELGYVRYQLKGMG